MGCLVSGGGRLPTLLAGSALACLPGGCRSGPPPYQMTTEGINQAWGAGRETSDPLPSQCPPGQAAACHGDTVTLSHWGKESGLCIPAVAHAPTSTVACLQWGWEQWGKGVWTLYPSCDMPQGLSSCGERDHLHPPSPPQAVAHSYQMEEAGLGSEASLVLMSK